MTEAFLYEVMLALVDGDEVRLDGLGTLSVRAAEMRAPATLLTGCRRQGGTYDAAVVEVRRKYYVKFRKSIRLREAIWARHGRLKARRVDDG